MCLEISLFKFPKDNTEKRRWINISVCRRKGAFVNFSPYNESKKNFVCEHHFGAGDIHVSLGIGRKTLKPDVIPSILNFRKPSKIKPTKSHEERYSPATNEPTDSDSYLQENLKITITIFAV